MAACGQPQSFAGGDDGALPIDGAPQGDGGPADAMEPPDPVEMCGAMPATPAEWEACYLKRFCEMRVHCDEQNRYLDAAECVALGDAVEDGDPLFDRRERLRAVADGRASIDTAAFAQCLAELAPARCATAAKAPSCATRYTGTVADQDSCYSDVECSSPGAQCLPHDCGAACCTGTCAPRKRLGDTCQQLDDCEPGLVCSTQANRCVLGDPGAACTRYECDPGGWCNAGTCAVDLVAGQPCDNILQCGGETTCVGVHRAPTAATCGRVTEVGDPCDWYCLGNLYCDLSNPTGLGVCRALPHHNESCSALVPCVGQTDLCNNGRCTARKAIGQPCVDGTCALGAFCTDQLGAPSPVCRALLADGDQGCTRPSQCQSHICSGTHTAPGQCRPMLSTCP